MNNDSAVSDKNGERTPRTPKKSGGFLSFGNRLTRKAEAVQQVAEVRQLQEKKAEAEQQQNLLGVDYVQKSTQEQSVKKSIFGNYSMTKQTQGPNSAFLGFSMPRVKESDQSAAPTAQVEQVETDDEKPEPQNQPAKDQPKLRLHSSVRLENLQPEFLVPMKDISSSSSTDKNSAASKPSRLIKGPVIEIIDAPSPIKSQAKNNSLIKHKTVHPNQQRKTRSSSVCPANFYGPMHLLKIDPKLELDMKPPSQQLETSIPEVAYQRKGSHVVETLKKVKDELEIKCALSRHSSQKSKQTGKSDNSYLESLKSPTPFVTKNKTNQLSAACKSVTSVGISARSRRMTITESPLKSQATHNQHSKALMAKASGQNSELPSPMMRQRRQCTIRTAKGVKVLDKKVLRKQLSKEKHKFMKQLASRFNSQQNKKHTNKKFLLQAKEQARQQKQDIKRVLEDEIETDGRVKCPAFPYPLIDFENIDPEWQEDKQLQYVYQYNPEQHIASIESSQEKMEKYVPKGKRDWFVLYKLITELDTSVPIKEMNNKAKQCGQLHDKINRNFAKGKPIHDQMDQIDKLNEFTRFKGCPLDKRYELKCRRKGEKINSHAMHKLMHNYDKRSLMAQLRRKGIMQGVSSKMIAQFTPQHLSPTKLKKGRGNSRLETQSKQSSKSDSVSQHSADGAVNLKLANASLAVPPAEKMQKISEVSVDEHKKVAVAQSVSVLDSNIDKTPSVVPKKESGEVEQPSENKSKETSSIQTSVTSGELNDMMFDFESESIKSTDSFSSGVVQTRPPEIDGSPSKRKQTRVSSPQAKARLSAATAIKRVTAAKRPFASRTSSQDLSFLIQMQNVGKYKSNAKQVAPVNKTAIRRRMTQNLLKLSETSSESPNKKSLSPNRKLPSFKLTKAQSFMLPQSSRMPSKSFKIKNNEPVFGRSHSPKKTDMAIDKIDELADENDADFSRLNVRGDVASQQKVDDSDSSVSRTSPSQIPSISVGTKRLPSKASSLHMRRTLTRGTFGSPGSNAKAAKQIETVKNDQSEVRKASTRKELEFQNEINLFNRSKGNEDIKSDLMGSYQSRARAGTDDSYSAFFKENNLNGDSTARRQSMNVKPKPVPVSPGKASINHQTSLKTDSDMELTFQGTFKTNKQKEVKFEQRPSSGQKLAEEHQKVPTFSIRRTNWRTARKAMSRDSMLHDDACNTASPRDSTDNITDKAVVSYINTNVSLAHSPGNSAFKASPVVIKQRRATIKRSTLQIRLQSISSEDFGDYDPTSDNHSEKNEPGAKLIQVQEEKSRKSGSTIGEGLLKESDKSPINIKESEISSNETAELKLRSSGAARPKQLSIVENPDTQRTPDVDLAKITSNEINVHQSCDTSTTHVPIGNLNTITAHTQSQRAGMINTIESLATKSMGFKSLVHYQNSVETFKKTSRKNMYEQAMKKLMTQPLTSPLTDSVDAVKYSTATNQIRKKTAKTHRFGSMTRTGSKFSGPAKILPQKSLLNSTMVTREKQSSISTFRNQVVESRNKKSQFYHTLLSVRNSQDPITNPSISNGKNLTKVLSARHNKAPRLTFVKTPLSMRKGSSRASSSLSNAVTKETKAASSHLDQMESERSLQQSRAISMFMAKRLERRGQPIQF